MNTKKLRGAAVAAVALAVVGGISTAYATSASNTAPSSYVALGTAVRVADTRPATQVGSVTGPVGANAVAVVNLAAANLPADATAVALNVVATAGTTGGVATVYADGSVKPGASNLNFAKGATVSNLVVVPVTDGKVDVWNGFGATQFVVDVEGYYTAAQDYTPPTTLTSSFTGPQTVNTGGSAASNAVEVTHLDLTAGTYQVSVNAKATPIVQGSATTEVFPQFFVYNQTLTASFTGNEFNVGAGALESGANTNVDSYYSGSGLVTVPATGETLHVYAFGYDSDRGAGTYTLDQVSVTAVPVAVPAS